jgi:hypothetical protein
MGRGFAIDETAQFVSDLNVARFVDRLRLEHDPTMRASLQGLLFKEMKNLGRDRKQLGNVQRQIAEGRRGIEIQKGVIESLAISGQDVGPAENTLRNLVEIQRIFEQCRHAILDGAVTASTNDCHELVGASVTTTSATVVPSEAMSPSARRRFGFLRRLKKTDFWPRAVPIAMCRWAAAAGKARPGTAPAGHHLGKFNDLMLRGLLRS